MLLSLFLGQGLIDLINSCAFGMTSTDGLLVDKRYKSIKRAVLKCIMKDYQYTRFSTTYPECFFPERGEASVGFHLNILEVAAEILLRLKKEDVALTPQKLYDDDSTRIFSYPATALAFQSICENIKTRFGKHVYPLCLMVSGDEVQINKKGSMDCKPFYVSIANIKGPLCTSVANIECVGYSPDWVHTKVS